MNIIDCIFDTFKETIFLKDDSNLKKQVEELKEIQKENNSPNINKDIKLLELGIKGEEAISFELKNCNLGLYVLRDVTIKHNDTKAQIDYVIVSKGYIYLVECKNLIGNIYVDSNGQFQREYEYNGKKIKESIYSPYTQAIRHKEILKSKWMSKNSKLSVAIGEKYFDKLWYKPLVVIANPKSILNIKFAPKDIKSNIVKVDNLIKYIENDIKSYDKSLLSSKKVMEEMAKNWLLANVNEYHSIADKYKTNEEKVSKLRQSLKDFRLEKARQMKVPPYYIFNDNELELIVKNNPKSEEELKKILPPIKVKCHGKEILQIIKK